MKFKMRSIILIVLFMVTMISRGQEINSKKTIVTGTISGSKDVCLRIPYTYTITENEAGAEYIWTVTHGDFIGKNTGTEVEILFTEPTATVSVVKKRIQNGITVFSEPLEFPVKGLALNAKIVSDNKQTYFYTSSATTFTIDLNGLEPDLITWSIKSNRGHRNFGNILSGIHDKTVTVSFNEVGGSSTGILRAEIAKCGVGSIVSFIINLEPKPIPEQFTIKEDCGKNKDLNTYFLLSKHVYDSEETVTLTIPDYETDHLYRWYFNGTSYIADSLHTKIQFTESHSYNIRLGITTPQGCTYMTPNENSQVVSIHEANFNPGNILPNPANFCDANITPLSYIAPVLTGGIKEIIWMCGNNEVGRGKEYQPTKSGYYWLILVNNYGGRYYEMVYYPRIVKICKN